MKQTSINILWFGLCENPCKNSQNTLKKVAKKVQVATSFPNPNSSSSYQKSSKKWNKVLQKLKYECSF